MARALFGLTFILLISARAFAFTQDFGFGPTSAGLGNMTAAIPADSFSAALNPARVGEGLTLEHRLRASYGFDYEHASFDSINNIVVANSVTSSSISAGSPQVGNYNPSVSDGLGQEVGVEYLLTDSMKWAVGVATFLPFNNLAAIDSGPIYLPSYVLDGTRWQLPRVVVSTGLEPTPGFRIGAGVDVGFSATANVDLTLQAGTSEASNQEVQMNMKPTLAPLIGMEVDTGFGVAGLTVRMQKNSTLALNTTATASVFGSIQAAIDFSYLSDSSIDFEPWSFELGYRFPEFAGITPIIQVDYQLWSNMQFPGAQISEPVNCTGNSSCTSQFSPTLAPDAALRNIFVFHAGAQAKLSDTIIGRLGYMYHPSIFSQLPADVGNLLDPDRHLFTVGVDFPLTSQLTLSLDANLELLVGDQVTKSEGDEFGNDASEKIGAPGYPIGGWIYGGGVTLSFTI